MKKTLLIHGACGKGNLICTISGRIVCSNHCEDVPAWVDLVPEPGETIREGIDGYIFVISK